MNRELADQSAASPRRYCTICESHFPQFSWAGRDVPILNELCVVGAGRRRAVCPVCRSLDRDRLLYAYLSANLIRRNGPIQLMHFAPEPALRSILSKLPNVAYTSADLTRKDVTLNLDIRNLHNIEDQRYSLVICNHVLEHIDDDARALSELYRILAPGSQAILQVPFSRQIENTLEDPSIIAPDERRKHFGQRDHVRIYQLDDYLRRVSNAGFDVTLEPATKLADQRSCEELGLNPDEPLVVARKS